MRRVADKKGEVFIMMQQLLSLLPAEIHSIAMMIELVVGKYFLPNLESDVAIPNLFVRDLRQFLADLNYSLSPAL